jgi:hypothetical protein
MKRHHLTIWIVFVTWAYWVWFYVCVFGELYMTWLVGALALKLLFPVAFVANITGAVLALLFPMKGRLWRIAAVALNIAPLAIAGYCLWWLFFGVRI